MEFLNYVATVYVPLLPDLALLALCGVGIVFYATRGMPCE